MARSACWMMSKASNGLNPITDGCESFLNRAHYIPGNKGASFKKLSKKKGLNASLLGSNTPWIFDPKSKTFKCQESSYNIQQFKNKVGHIYKQHVLNFFSYTSKKSKLMRLKTLKINDPINWFRRYEIECRTIEKGFAAHGTADYIIGPLIGEEKTLKVRSYKLNHPHLNPNTGEPI